MAQADSDTDDADNTPGRPAEKPARIEVRPKNDVRVFVRPKN